MLGTSRSTDAGEAKTQLGVSAGPWEKGASMWDFGVEHPRSSVRRVLMTEAQWVVRLVLREQSTF